MAFITFSEATTSLAATALTFIKLKESGFKEGGCSACFVPKKSRLNLKWAFSGEESYTIWQINFRSQWALFVYIVQVQSLEAHQLHWKLSGKLKYDEAVEFEAWNTLIQLLSLLLLSREFPASFRCRTTDQRGRETWRQIRLELCSALACWFYWFVCSLRTLFTRVSSMLSASSLRYSELVGCHQQALRVFRKSSSSLCRYSSAKLLFGISGSWTLSMKR